VLDLVWSTNKGERIYGDSCRTLPVSVIDRRAGRELVVATGGKSLVRRCGVSLGHLSTGSVFNLASL
jgi:hypothetical protein